MKLTLTLTLLLVLLTTLTYAQIPSYVPSNGLVGWWPFIGNANDESGNGNNGTVNGATLTTDRFGVADKAYSFDGVNDYLSGTIGNIASANVITLSTWMKYVGNAGGQPYDLYFQLGQYGNHTLAYAYNYNANLLDLHSNCFSNPYYNVNLNNDWHNVIVVDSFTVTKVYVDAILVTTFNSGSNQECFLGSNLFFIGGGADNQFVTGSLDDIGIWNRALSACEIQDLYHADLGYSTVNAGLDQSICRGQQVVLQGSGGNSLVWNNGVTDNDPFVPNQTDAYVLTGTDSLGCVGTDTVLVTVLENATSTINETAIDSYTLNGQVFTVSGTYTQTLIAANGCDSVITLNIEIDYTGLNDQPNASFSLYPNPVRDIMTIVGLKGELFAFSIYSVEGKLVKSGQTSGEIQLEDLKKGNYLLKIENESLSFVKL